MLPPSAVWQTIGSDRAVDEWAERVDRFGNPDALHVLPPVARGVIKQVPVPELQYFGRPGEAGFGPGSQLGKRVPPLARRRVGRERPVHKVA